MPDPKTNSLRWLAAGALALALPLAASAQEAYTRGTPSLRAGPSQDYPVVARLADGQPLNVVGCTGGYAWCDVVLPDGLRGWVAASRLDYAWGSDVVPLVNYGAAEAARIAGHPSADLAALLGQVGEPELIHRDNLVITAPRDETPATP